MQHTPISAILQVSVLVTLLSLALCCQAQWNENSTCAAIIKLDQTWPSNYTGNYLAMLDIASPQALPGLHATAHM